MRPSVLHLRDPGISIRGALPLFVGRSLLALAIQSHQVFPRRCLNPRCLRQSPQKLLVTLSRVPSYYRTHRRVRLQRGRIDRNPLALQQSPIRQYSQHPTEYFPMRVHIDEPPRSRNRGMIRGVLVQPNPHENDAVPKSPPTARQYHAPLRCLRNTQSVAPESKSQVPATAAHTGPHKTSRTAPRQIRRNLPPPVVRSVVDKTDVPELPPTHYVRSTNHLAFPSACASPSPCLKSTNHPCELRNLFRARNQTCTTGC